MKKFLGILPLLILWACNPEQPFPDSRLVLEGWIDSGGHPMVLLSETIPMGDGQISQNEMISGIAKYAKVTVSDGDKSVILTGKVDTRYFPPYVFTSAKITGTPGKTYIVNAEYKDYKASASTTIPEPVQLDTIFPRVMKDSVYTIVCGFTDPPGERNFYRAFSKTTGKDERYQPSTLAYASDEVFEGYTELILWNTQRLMAPLYHPNISLGDEVWVKFCTMDEKTFNFWSNYEVTLATNANAMYYFDTDMRVNVEGALGYWAGYGVSEYKVKVRPTEK